MAEKLWLFIGFFDDTRGKPGVVVGEGHGATPQEAWKDWRATAHLEIGEQADFSHFDEIWAYQVGAMHGFVPEDLEEAEEA